MDDEEFATQKAELDARIDRLLDRMVDRQNRDLAFAFLSMVACVIIGYMAGWRAASMP